MSQIYLKLSLPKHKHIYKSGMKWVRAALSYELETSKRLQGAHTLTRSKINVSKSKLWRQKGTGRARAGSKSSPLWKGGGVVFGPNTDVSIKTRNMNRKIWKKAIELILYNKRGRIIVVEGPWNFAGTPSAQFHAGYKKFLSLMKAQQAHYLVLAPSHISLKPCKEELAKAPTSKENLANTYKALNMVSFSTVKCVDLLRADYVILIV